MDDHAWALVLAAGEGTRVAALATGPDGVATPKQYCAFGTGRTLLDRTLDRTRPIATSDRTAIVVARAHARWWRELAAANPEATVVVQPRNRGTAAGVLLPLLRILARDPDATVVVLPSDHAVRDEAAWTRSIAAAIRLARNEPACVVVLGMTPASPSTDFGWIVPFAGHSPSTGARRIERFVEKPPLQDAMRLYASGALWSTFVLAARGRTLEELCAATLPDLRTRLKAATEGSPRALDEAYDGLEPRDFSRDVLAPAARSGSLLVLRVPECGWSDLGTPERVTSWSQPPRGSGPHAVA